MGSVLRAGEEAEGEGEEGGAESEIEGVASGELGIDFANFGFWILCLGLLFNRCQQQHWLHGAYMGGLGEGDRLLLVAFGFLIPI